MAASQFAVLLRRAASDAYSVLAADTIMGSAILNGSGPPLEMAEEADKNDDREWYA